MRRVLAQFLHLWAILGFVLAQPLLDLLSRNRTFLIYHQLDRLDLVLLASLLCLGLPAALLASEILVFRGGRRIYQTYHLLLVGVSAGAFSLLLLVRLVRLPAFVLLPAAGALGLFAAWGYNKSRQFRLFLIFLSPSTLLFFFFFLVSTGKVAPPSAESAPPRQVERSSEGPDIPVVIVIFDGLPLLSLMNRDHEIDPLFYPNFAELATAATFYRNATTSWCGTDGSLTSLLTAKIGTLNPTPTLTAHPRNLFTLLERTHELRVFEEITRLAPPAPSEAGEEAPRRPRRQRLAAVLDDLVVIYLHLLLPDEIRRRLPPLSGTWGNFRDFAENLDGGDAQGGAIRFIGGDLLHPDDRVDKFRTCLEALEVSEKPRFYFCHVLLPHHPLRYLPSGKRYGMKPSTTKLPTEAWETESQFALEIYQRHLLQVMFVDRLLGEVVARLKETALYDRSVLVVTSDHGSSFWPGGDTRNPELVPYPEDILRVPLLIKGPFQHQGLINDDDVQLLDIMPTIADLLDLDLPWEVDGRSALRSASLPPRKKIIRGDSGRPVTFDPGVTFNEASLDRKLSLFDPVFGGDRLYRVGRHRDLIGRRLEDLPLTDTADCSLQIEQEEALRAYDPQGDYVPSRITGKLSCSSEPDQPLYVGIAVNGTIRAVPRASMKGKGVGRFGAVVPEAAFVAGRNRAETFLVIGEPEVRRFLRPAR
ncbi:MAG: sulfatase-like hydrolase/transferase [bacterium]|nr:sulfatase-like hydrolase/transferase [bacterium]